MTLDGPLCTHCCQWKLLNHSRQPSRAFRATQHVHGATRKSPTKKYMFSLIYFKLRRLHPFDDINASVVTLAHSSSNFMSSNCSIVSWEWALRVRSGLRERWYLFQRVLDTRSVMKMACFSCFENLSSLPPWTQNSNPDTNQEPQNHHRMLSISEIVPSKIKICFKL